MKNFPSFPLLCGFVFSLETLHPFGITLAPDGEVKSNRLFFSSANLLSHTVSSLSCDASLPQAEFFNLPRLVPTRSEEPCPTSVGVQLGGSGGRGQRES